MRVIADRYELVAFVGRGGMGEVWEGRDLVIERRVAVKLLPDQQHGPAADLFFREARTAGGLNQRGVVTVHDLGRDPRDGTLYLIMEYVAGRNLAVVLGEDGPPPPAASVEWAAQTAAALAAAHDAGVVHRDLKPANLMLTAGGEVKVLDFGIARFMATTDKSSQVMGTLAYMAPERFAEHPGDARSDLYAFGCVLHELLTGEAPFRVGDPVSLMTAHLHKAPDAPSSLRAGLPAALDALVLRLLAKQPEDRPQSAASVHDELRALDLASAQPTMPAAPARPSAAPATAPAAPATPPAPAEQPPYVPSAPEQPPAAPAAHQLPTQTAAPFAPGNAPDAADGPAAFGPPTPAAPDGLSTPSTPSTPTAPGRRRALLLGLGGAAAVVAGGTGLALALSAGDGGDGKRTRSTGAGAEASPRRKVRPWRHDAKNDFPAMCGVADGVLYVATNSTIIALDARTGRKRWAGPDLSFSPDQPTVADGTLYVGGGDTLWALDTEGGKKWAFPAGGQVRGRPVVAGGTVYFVTMEKHVYAVRTDGGRKAWSRPLGGETYGSPTVADGTVYVGSSGKDDTLYALDAADGAKKWAFHAGSGFTQKPVVSGGLVYATAGDTVYALHAGKGTKKWAVRGTASTEQTLRLAGDRLFIAGDDDRVHALDPSTGAKKWSKEGMSTVNPTQLAVAGGLVCFGENLSESGTVRALDTEDGSERWTISTGASMAPGNRDNGPVAAYGFVYVTNVDGVVAVDAATGAAPGMS